MEPSTSMSETGSVNISVTEADRSILSVARAAGVRLGTEIVSLEQAAGRVLREEIVADRPLPPFDRVTMDGIAIDSRAFLAGARKFRVTGTQAAGAPRSELTNRDGCIEVMTGAMLPEGCDCVIPVEEIARQGDQAVVGDAAAVAPGYNIHATASDYEAGTILLRPGRRLGPAELAVCASAGKTTLSVARNPRIAVVSTGDELVPVDQVPKAHQIRRSNSYAVAAAAHSRGFTAIEMHHLADRREEIASFLRTALEKFDVIVTSGGVSMGRFDLLPPVLSQLGVVRKFHRVLQRPGKPFWFGAREQQGAGGAVVFGLPGNPVSTTVCTVRYLIPYLEALTGRSLETRPAAVLTDEFRFEPDLTMFLPVRISFDTDGRTLADPRPSHGSGDYARLTESDGFVELSRGRDLYEAGTAWPYYSWT